MSGYDYRPFLPPPGTSKIAGRTPREHTQARTKNNSRAQGMFANWERMLNGPFRGITTEGQVVPALFALRPEGAPTLAMIGRRVSISTVPCESHALRRQARNGPRTIVDRKRS